MVRLRSNPLERAMRRAAGDPEAFQDDFFAALLESTLVVPRGGPYWDDRGREIRPIFSSMAVLQELARGEAYEERPAGEVFALLLEKGSPVVLNAGGDIFYEFSADEVQALAQGLLPGEAKLESRKLPAGHRLALRLPEENPVALKQALLMALDGLPAVKAAFLLEAGDEERYRFFLGIELLEADVEEMDEVMAALDPVLQENLGPGQLLDAAMLNGTSLARACRDLAPPFFQR
jgi:hypothetical protein